ncbi:cytochrome c biogenesis protein CcsA [Paenibacillus athensensis]|uniref:Heme exporter protein C n=1 Tax=Paenibacillus athensensis TaxID=1967502 RepID=A0A4Y8Q1Z1_9BACL|nr:cytochrome c biogenesis protein CcsA [Paenibacillus athensensis]MCD1261059.1 cytochrome c biogenesis protein CcsA [Paenibacillus athensensis]
MGTTTERTLGILALISMIAALYLGLIYAPVESKMGIVQKIFYVHVGSAWSAFFAFFIVFVFSVAFLISKKQTHDHIANISAEVGFLFTTMVLITGPIWGRSSWNAWWSWEPRLTTTLILWFIFLGYFMIRRMDGLWEKKARLAAVFGIIGFIDVPIVFMSIRWWETKQHPIVFGSGPSQKGGGVEPEMLVALLAMLLAFTLLYFFMLYRGIVIAKLQQETNRLKEALRELA